MMSGTSQLMTISELSNRSMLPLSTIKFYIREQLIPGPNLIRGTRAYYDARHLNRLKLIRKIQRQGKVPLSTIKEIIALVDHGANEERQRNGSRLAASRHDIVGAAINVFREKGYEQTTIADIVAAARIGRSSFYKNFENKKELFIECVKSIILSEVADPAGNGDDAEISDGAAVFDKHAKAYNSINPLWLEMVRQLRAAAINHPEEFAGSLDEVIQLKIDLLRRGIQRGIRKGWFRQINATLMTVMLLGLQDYQEYLAKTFSNKKLEELYEEARDIILYGILKE